MILMCSTVLLPPIVILSYFVPQFKMMNFIEKAVWSPACSYWLCYNYSCRAALSDSVKDSVLCQA